MKGGEVCYSIEYNIYISPRQHCYYLLMQTCFIVILLFLHPSFLNREVQHLCDSQSTKCEEHNHCCKGQLAQLGARLHVVSPSSSSDKSLSSPSAPPSPSLIPLLSSSHLRSTSAAWVVLLFFSSLAFYQTSSLPPFFFNPPSKVPFIPVLFHIALPLRTSASNVCFILFFICSPLTPLPLSSSFSTLAPSQPFFPLLCHFS